MTHRVTPAQNQILDDYLAEPIHDRDTLQRYIELYPAESGALLDLHFALLGGGEEELGGHKLGDEAAIAKASAAIRAQLKAAPVDPFLNMTPQNFTRLRESIGIRAATLAGFRDRTVDVGTVPSWVLRALAEACNVALADFLAFLVQPPRLASALSFRAEQTPQAATQKVSFVKLLESANETTETRERLLAD